MPRVKLVYQEYGEWAPATGQLGVCKHPRERLRFDGSFALPSFMYCRDCGTRFIHPHHGLTQEEIDAARKEARQLMSDLGIDEEGEQDESENDHHRQ